MPSDSRDKALSIVKTKGPVLPGQVNKELNMNVLFASAVLSELVDSKLIKLSHAKIGGSPVYYAVGQEPRLGQALQQIHRAVWNICYTYGIRWNYLHICND